MSSGVAQLNAAGQFVGALVESGVTDFVISPGSRSTPLVLAISAHPDARATVVIDERAAAFFALAQSKLTLRPTALLCTSGSAGAHYFPAIIEASAAGAPLIALTADRPTALMNCGAPQTIDQANLYGRHVRAAFDIQLHDLDDEAVRSVRRVAAQAVRAAVFPYRGAVQVNLRARKPLEPEESLPCSQSVRRSPVMAHVQSRPPVTPRVLLEAAEVDALASRIAGAARGLIVCGPAPVDAARRDAVLALAASSGMPLMAESTSQLRFGPAPGVTRLGAIDALLDADFGVALDPDLIIQIGAAPVSAAWPRYLARHRRTPRVVIADAGWPDPDSSAEQVVVADIESLALALADRLSAPSADRRVWREALAIEDRRAFGPVEAALSESDFHEGKVAAVTFARLPRGGVVFLGNGLCVRHADRFTRPSDSDGAVPRIVAQRGASGIDGHIATVAGLASEGSPVTALFGDVAFIHDAGSLALLQRAGSPAAIVVINNDGGRIFEQLPVANVVDEATLASWTTPHGRDFAALCAAYELEHRCVRTEAELQFELTQTYRREGATIIEAKVDPHRYTEINERLRSTQ